MLAFRYAKFTTEAIERPVQSLRSSVRRTPHSESQFIAI